MQFPVKNPSPSFELLEKVLRGEKKPERVRFVELFIDFEVIEFIVNKIMGEKLPSFEDIKKDKINRFIAGEKVVLLATEEEKNYLKHYIDFFYYMGYDCVPDVLPSFYLRDMILPRIRTTDDTATLPRGTKGKRQWVEEGKGIITSWEDFEKFHWERMELDLEDYYDFLSKNLPEGMKLTVMHSMFEHVLEWFLGYEGLFYLLYDQPDLVEEIFNKWGKTIYRFYESVAPLECVGAFFHADDLGFKTGTMINPEILRKIFFPWLKKYTSLAHNYGKTFWYHCCGNVSEIMEDLIEDIKIDGFHSFQDVIIPVAEFKKKYGNRIATLGGVDMDKLCRLGEKDLRKYIRNILDQCMPGGRFALGSGNTIANYVPVQNYFIMINEALKWK